MRGEDWFQKVLYLVIAVLSGYILYKGAGLLANSSTVQSTLDSGSLQRTVEDAAMRAYAPGYTAAIEGRDGSNWMAGWMRQIVPAYSYLAEGQADEEETVQETELEGEAGTTAENVMVAGTEDGGAETNQGNGPKDGTEQTGDAAGAQAAADASKTANEAGAADTPELNDMQDTADVPEKANEAGAADTPGLNNAPGTAEPSEKTATSEIAETPETIEILEIAEETKTADMPDGTEAAQEAVSSGITDILREQLRDYDYLLANYYTVDTSTTADAELLDADTLLNADLRIERNPEVPQILIYHTHSQETFVDSVEGEVNDSIVGMGEVLAEELRGTYGFQVIHDTGVYDLVDGVLDRSAAYDYARASVEQILQENPTIEVIIDLHRDGVEGQKFVTEIDGRPTSMIMFFNGICRNEQAEPLYWLENPYIEQNLAFSLQLELKAREQYPGYTRNIYLQAERFNLHLRPRSLLIEAGTQLNTVEEERNAMIPLADLINQVLSGI